MKNFFKFLCVVFYLLTITIPLHSQWVQINGPYGGEISSIAVSDINLFTGTSGGGVFLSTNNGTYWTAANNGLTNLNVKSFSVYGTNLFAGTNGGVFLSTNNGTNWSAVCTDVMSYTSVFSFVIVDTNLFSGTNCSVWKRPLSEMCTLIIPKEQNTQSAIFDGIKDRIRVLDASPVNPSANPSAYQITGKSITVEAWIYPMSLPKFLDAGMIVNRPYASPAYQEPWRSFELRIDNFWGPNDDPRIQWIISDGNVPGNWGGTLDPNPPVVGAWTHVSGTYDGTKLRLYINGNLVDESDYTADIGAGDTGFYIGGLSTQYFKGLIDEVRLWNIVRTQTEIQSTMNETLVGNEPGLKGYWPMDSLYITGNGIFATVDKTSNHNDLAIQYHSKLVPFPQGSSVHILPTYVASSDSYALIGELFSAKLYGDGWPIPGITVIQKPSGMIVVGDSLFWTPQENQFLSFPVVVSASNSVGTIEDTLYVFSEAIRSAQNQVRVDVTHRGKLGAFGVYGKGILYKSKNGLSGGDFSLIDRDNDKYAGGLYSTSNSFKPIEGFTNVSSRFPGFTSFKTSFTDEWETNRIDVRVYQTVHSSVTTGDDKYAIIEYCVVNESGAPIGDLFAQLTADFDIGDAGITYVHTIRRRK